MAILLNAEASRRDTKSREEVVAANVEDEIRYIEEQMRSQRWGGFFTYTTGIMMDSALVSGVTAILKDAGYEVTILDEIKGTADSKYVARLKISWALPGA
jgi:hypothetical protein